VIQYGASGGSWKTLYYPTGSGSINYKLSLAGPPHFSVNVQVPPGSQA